MAIRGGIIFSLIADLWICQRANRSGNVGGVMWYLNGDLKIRWRANSIVNKKGGNVVYEQKFKDSPAHK